MSKQGRYGCWFNEGGAYFSGSEYIFKLWIFERCRKGDRDFPVLLQLRASIKDVVALINDLERVKEHLSNTELLEKKKEA